MAVRDDFSPGEVLTSSDLNDTFAAKAPFSYGTAEPTTTVEGFIWFDENDDPATPKYWDGSEFVPFPSGAGDAVISSPAATGQYTDTGVTYDYYTFTSSGTLTVDTAGFADVLVVAGGGGSRTGDTYIAGGGAGGMLELTDAYLPAGSLTVTVGAGGSASSTRNAANRGNDSLLGAFVAVGGGGGGSSAVNGFQRSGDSGGSGSGASSGTDPQPGKGVTNQGNLGGGVTSGFGAGGGAGGAASGGTAGVGKGSSITGSSVTYAKGGASSGTNTANTGDGGQGDNSGNSGVVIVRVRTN